MSMKQGRSLRLLLVIATVSTIGCDRVTKHMAATSLPETPTRSFLADTVRLEYAENTGAFLGLGADWAPPLQTAIFIIGNGLLLIGLAVIATRRHWQRLALLGAALMVAGGTSNLMDRISYGMVIDFMNVGIGPVRTGIFNVADMAILLGVGIVVLERYTRATDGGP
jgi:signal peptidase II